MRDKEEQEKVHRV